LLLAVVVALLWSPPPQWLEVLVARVVGLHSLMTGQARQPQEVLVHLGKDTLAAISMGTQVQTTAVVLVAVVLEAWGKTPRTTLALRIKPGMAVLELRLQ
jgi:hypothetical protein